MNRPILVCALIAMTAASLGAQQASQSSPYEGTSNPPPDDTIVTTVTVRSTPVPGQQVYVQSSVPAQDATPGQLQAAGRSAVRQSSAQPVNEANGQMEPGSQPTTQGSDDDVLPGSTDPALNLRDPSMDTPVYRASRPQGPALSQSLYAADPDGDIVHPQPMRPGELGAGTTIRVRLMHRLSTGYSERGEAFRTRVASDVVQGNLVLIPAGAEIDGQVVQVSRGHAGGYGTMRLRPETVVLADGTRYKLYAEVTAAPGSGNKIQGEGTIRAGSQVKRDGVEYGAAVGGGAVTGALLGGPIGALTGSLVGAGFVTVHLLVSHPQATLESGTALQFTLTEPLYLSQAGLQESSSIN